MNIEIEDVDLKNSLFADFKQELENNKLDFSAIHYLQGNKNIMKIAFDNQLAEELKDR